MIGGIPGGLLEKYSRRTPWGYDPVAAKVACRPQSSRLMWAGSSGLDPWLDDCRSSELCKPASYASMYRDRSIDIYYMRSCWTL